MTCGMLCVMRREGRGVLHLGKYSPPKEICSGEEERKREKKKRGEEKRKIKRKRKIKKEERQRKGKRTSSYLINKQRSCRSERICTLRGRGSLLRWLVFV